MDITAIAWEIAQANLQSGASLSSGRDAAAPLPALPPDDRAAADVDDLAAEDLADLHDLGARRPVDGELEQRQVERRQHQLPHQTGGKLRQLEGGQARADGARFLMIATDGVFSMDGYLAKLPDIRALADAYGAMVMVDDCHATGFMGPEGRGTPAHFGVQVDLLPGTLGKALGGALGGYIAGPQAVIDLLRQRARPYLFSNALPPAVVGAALAALDIVEAADDLRAQLFDNARYWRAGLERAGFRLLAGEHPIVPVMFADEHEAVRMASALFGLGIYVVAFSYPVVPMGKARIRVQICATHTSDDIDKCVAAFVAARDQR